MEIKKTFLAESDGQAGLRLDIFLKGLLPAFSRSFIQEKIKKGEVLVNGVRAENDYRTRRGDSVTLDFDISRPRIYKSDVNLDIIFEDDDILAVNKPSGMVVHPACGNYSGTLVNALMSRYGIDEISLSGSNDCRLGIVHRLDKETSGIILVAKNVIAKNLLGAQFAERRIEKEYRAIACGIIRENKGLIDAPVARDRSNRKKMKIDFTGKQAGTSFEVIERFDRHTYLAAFPKTGRTHQLRTHFSYIKHPLAGDPVYGGELLPGLGISRVMLHAYRISFLHPGKNTELSLSAPLPADFSSALESLRKNKAE